METPETLMNNCKNSNLLTLFTLWKNSTVNNLIVQTDKAALMKNNVARQHKCFIVASV